MEGRCLPVQEKKTTEKMHTPYAGIILFRFKGTFSAWPAASSSQMASFEAGRRHPWCFLSLTEYKRIKL